MPKCRQLKSVRRNSDFSKCVRSRLKELDLRQHDLADALTVSDGMVSQILSHPERMSVEKLQRICSFLDMDSDAVIPFIGCRTGTCTRLP